jgi:hypothetical protein
LRSPLDSPKMASIWPVMTSVGRSAANACQSSLPDLGESAVSPPCLNFAGSRFAGGASVSGASLMGSSDTSDSLLNAAALLLVKAGSYTGDTSTSRLMEVMRRIRVPSSA